MFKSKKTNIKISLILFFAVAFTGFYIKALNFSAEEEPPSGQTQVANITNNGDSYEGSTTASPNIPKYEKFELTFDINRLNAPDGDVLHNLNNEIVSGFINPYWPYDPDPVSNQYSIWNSTSEYNMYARVKKDEVIYEAIKKVLITDHITPGEGSTWTDFWKPNPGDPISAGKGITVEGRFSNDNWATTLVQPAFYYVDYSIIKPLNPANASERDKIYPSGTPVWKIRFATETAGNWQYQIYIRDITGATVYSNESLAFAVNNNAISRGFVKVSDDKRYFETSDGQYLNLVGGTNTMNYSKEPTNMDTYFALAKERGVNFIRPWWQSSQGPALFGMTNTSGQFYESHWSATDGGRTGGTTGDFYKPNLASGTDNVRPGDLFSFQINSKGSIGTTIDIKPSTSYYYKIVYKTKDLVGGGVNMIACDNSCAVLTGSTTGTDWLTQEGDFASLADQYGVTLKVENASTVTAGQTNIAEISVKEILGENTYGPELVNRPNPNAQNYISQYEAWKADYMLNAAKENDIYLKIVLEAKEDGIFCRIKADGTVGPYDNSSNYLYGEVADSASANRVYQTYYWRYIAARYGYSSNVHSFELFNETDPTNGNVSATMYAFASYFNYQGFPVKNLTSSSFSQYLYNLRFQDPLSYIDWHNYVSDSNPYGGSWEPIYLLGWRNWAPYQNVNYSGLAFNKGQYMLKNDEGLYGSPYYKSTFGTSVQAGSWPIPIAPNNNYTLSWQVKGNIRNPEPSDPAYPVEAGGIGGGVYKSNNSGETWNYVTGNTEPARFVSKIAFDDSGNLYATTRDITGLEVGIYKLPNGTNSWVPLRADSGFAYFTSIAIDGDNIFLGGALGEPGYLYRSTDQGDTFEVIDVVALSLPRITTMVIDTVSKDVYMGTNGKGVYKSTDNGSTWTQLNTTTLGLGLTINKLHFYGGVLYAATNIGIFTFNGTVWTKLSTGGLVKAWANDFVVNGDGDIIANFDFAEGFFRLNNGETTWTEINNGVESRYATSMAYDNNGVLYATTTSHLLKTTDDGNNWTVISSTPSRMLTSIAFDSSNNLYVSANRPQQDTGTSGFADVDLLLQNSWAEHITLGTYGNSKTIPDNLSSHYLPSESSSSYIDKSITFDTHDSPLNPSTWQYNYDRPWYLVLNPTINSAVGEVYFRDFKLHNNTTDEDVIVPNGSFDDGRVDYDSALLSYFYGSALGVPPYRVVNKPIIVGESGLQVPKDSNIEYDTDYTWYKKFIWGHINPYGVTSIYWDQGFAALENDKGNGYINSLKYASAYQSFLSGINLSNGKYKDISATVSDSSSLRAWGQKEITDGKADKAHLWIDNKAYTWKAVADHNFDPAPHASGLTSWTRTYFIGEICANADKTKVYKSLKDNNLHHAVTETDWWQFVRDWQPSDNPALPAPVSGMITIPNMKDGTYHLKWYNTSTGDIDHEEELSTSNSNLNISVTDLVSDVALKVEFKEITPVESTLSKLYTYKSKYKINGTKSSEVTKVLVNGQEAIIDGNNWNIELELAIGLTQISAVGQDQFGNSSKPAIYNLMRRKAGDANDDTFVDILDFGSLLNDWNKVDVVSDSDYNEDNKVNINDFAILMFNWNK
ncbi:MAG: hypothetical protein WCW17_02915 [Patescibacteria group bacterium]